MSNISFVIKANSHSINYATTFYTPKILRTVYDGFKISGISDKHSKYEFYNLVLDILNEISYYSNMWLFKQLREACYNRKSIRKRKKINNKKHRNHIMGPGDRKTT